MIFLGKQHRMPSARPKLLACPNRQESRRPKTAEGTRCSSRNNFAKTLPAVTTTQKHRNEPDPLAASTAPRTKLHERTESRSSPTPQKRRNEPNSHLTASTPMHTKCTNEPNSYPTPPPTPTQINIPGIIVRLRDITVPLRFQAPVVTVSAPRPSNDIHI
jgi:hypothetical protein